MAVVSKAAVAGANVKFAQLEGQIVLGDESAKVLGVEPGTRIDLGVLAHYQTSWVKRCLVRWRHRHDRDHDLAIRYQAYAASQAIGEAA